MIHRISANQCLKISLSIILCLMPFILKAQDSDFARVKFIVSKKYKAGTRNETVQYAVFKTYKQAINAKQKLEDAIKNDFKSGTAISQKEQVMQNIGRTWKQTSANGICSEMVMTGMGVLFIADDDMEVVEVKTGEKKYNVVIDMKHSLTGVVVDGRFKNAGPHIKKMPSMDNGSEVSFDINLSLPAGYTTDQSRLIIQPMAIDCQTEDTLAYLKPIIFESKEYHALQNRRMDFKYNKKDPLAQGFTQTVVLKSDQPFDYDTTIVYRKPNKDMTYKGSYTCVLEDYHHVIWSLGEGTGSCLSFKPFKFMNFSVAAAELPLSAEFQQTPEENFQTIPRNLKLKFEVGKDVLSSDSLNRIELEKLVKELKSYGDRLMQVKISGSSSPEGSLQLNQTLAQKRATAALNLIRRYLSRDIRVGTETPKVYTWNDVLEEVKLQGDTLHTAMVRNVIANNNERDVFGILSKLPIYEQVILPILENQRIMKCSYIYETQHIMDANEVVAAYYENKDKLLKGEKDFSDGDYFNLFAAITDSVELDNITRIAYNHIIKQPGYVNLKFAPYAANRMALLNIRKGTPDPKVLAPFIDYTAKSIDLNRKIDEFNSRIVNRSEILINQAITYFQDQKLDTAEYILEWLPVTEATNKLRKYVDFSKYYIAKLENRLPEALMNRVENAEKFVLDNNNENKAIIYTELHSQLGKSPEECERWVDKMNDSNPKKWYLKGILWADKALKSKQDDMDFDNDDANTPDNDSQIPDFLAYFQHSFDLEPKYKRLYFNEGNVSDDVRKKFRYKKRNISAYRERFKALYENANNKVKNSNNKENVSDTTENKQNEE